MTQQGRGGQGKLNTVEEAHYNQITEAIIGAAIKVHRTLGPGLLESAYQACLAYELALLGLLVETEKPLPLIYGDVRLDCGYRLDLLVAELVIVEVKSIAELAPILEAQMISYLKLSGCKVGLLTNFNVKYLKYGIKRIVHNYS